MQWNEPRLLIADDDRDFRESLGQVFSRRGFLTELAADGCEALEIVQSTEELHLVMLDVHMPRLTGLQTLEKIRQLSDKPLPCVLMSAKLDDSIRAYASKLDTAGMLSKPFSLRDVTAAVDDILQRAYGWRRT